MPISRNFITECWVGLVFISPAAPRIGNQGDVDRDGVLVSHLETKLANRFEEGQGLDVAHGSADFDDEHVHVAGALENARLDLVGDVRDHLHRASQVLSAPLLLDDGLVDLARGRVVEATHPLRQEPFVVPEIQIGLGAVVGDEDLPMLHGVHGSRIDVEIRVEFLDGDFEASGFEQRTDRSRCQSLAEG